MSRTYPSYEGALTAAGAVVIASRQFGSYQGDAWAKVRYNGGVHWVTWAYGSCSGCDSLEATFNYDFDPTDPKKLQMYKDFGADYLENLLTQEQAEEEAGKNIEWDTDAEDMLKWIKMLAINDSDMTAEAEDDYSVSPS